MKNNPMKWPLFAVLLLAFSGCKPSLPDGILSKGDMEDILYDYHLAQTMAERNESRPIDERTYEDAVFRKYEVTQEQFDASLAYYMRHTGELHEIYENIAERYKKEAEALGVSESDLNKYSALSATGDTANIWSGDKSFLLMPKVPFNHKSFSFQTDSSFHKGDKLMLNFDVNYIYQDGMRNAAVVMAMRFANDSVATTNIQITNSNHFRLTLADDARLGIKEVRGYFILNQSQGGDVSSTTLQLMFIDNIQLIRMHENRKVEEERSKQDSAKAVGDFRSSGGRIPPSTNAPLPPPRLEGVPNHSQRVKEAEMIPENLPKNKSVVR
ncbi:DUF4296 domain-containing protein [Prevotella sp. KH2C16]|uniref:DUF4296 domain-containing protein n=1 Tax=Prevotella sp. KH2C16 TaxID=1855325 RepID=UPI0008EFF3B1|nr:DUF4296 domain-containing protein [Prevotella sp. KH2C16]SFG10119.1 protein of unknown function [Prevotella sp. KH2C16]